MGGLFDPLTHIYAIWQRASKNKSVNLDNKRASTISPAGIFSSLPTCYAVFSHYPHNPMLHHVKCIISSPREAWAHSTFLHLWMTLLTTEWPLYPTKNSPWIFPAEKVSKMPPSTLVVFIAGELLDFTCTQHVVPDLLMRSFNQAFFVTSIPPDGKTPLQNHNFPQKLFLLT